MTEKVYFVNLRARDPHQNTVTKLRRLFDKAGFGGIIEKNDLVPVKIHFGEWGNDSYINPVYVRQIVDKIKEYGGKPFLTDSNTLYKGSRSNAVDHIVTAVEHGFDFAVTGAPLVIADGLRGTSVSEVQIQKKHFERVLISGDIAVCNSIIVLSHFKGHEVAGFGGAIKNLAMGCAPPAGKQAQHSALPVTIEGHCIGCGKCVGVCLQGAVSLVNKKSVIDGSHCTGCFECMTICPENAIDVDWETEIPVFTERMVEHAYGALHGKQNKAGFINFLTRITPDCDCVPWSDAPIVPDIGILASSDPVAIDAASFDLVNKQVGFSDSLLSSNYETGADKFRGLRKNTNGYRQIEYAEEIGLGTGTYEIVEL
jgi:uncharacterized Fe-S center protein